jgi:hypothetical protein
MNLAVLCRKATDPPAFWATFTVPAKSMMHLVNKAQGDILPGGILRPAENPKTGAHGKGVRPQVPLWSDIWGIKAGQTGKVKHDFLCHDKGCIHVRYVSCSRPEYKTMCKKGSVEMLKT